MAMRFRSAASLILCAATSAAAFRAVQVEKHLAAASLLDEYSFLQSRVVEEDRSDDHAAGTCNETDEAVLDGHEAARLLSRYHQENYPEHVLLFPGASPSWILRAMEARQLAPCSVEQNLCKWFAISSDVLRLRLNNFAILSVARQHPHFASPEMIDFFMKYGLSDSPEGVTGPLAKDLHPEKLVDWIKLKMCPYLEEAGLKEAIQANKVLLVDHTTTTQSILGLAHVFKDCQHAWSEAAGATSPPEWKPLPFVNLVEPTNRIMGFAHSWDRSLVETKTQIVVASLMKYYISDETPFGRWVPPCKLLHIEKGCPLKPMESNKTEAALQLFQSKSPVCQRRGLKAGSDAHGQQITLPERVFEMPSLDDVAGTLDKGFGASWEEMKALLKEKVKEVPHASCGAVSWCSLFSKWAGFYKWPEEGWAEYNMAMADAFIVKPGFTAAAMSQLRVVRHPETGLEIGLPEEEATLFEKALESAWADTGLKWAGEERDIEKHTKREVAGNLEVKLERLHNCEDRSDPDVLIFMFVLSGALKDSIGKIPEVKGAAENSGECW
eukprot:TRINITY_DN29921_c0_g1_i3.p1 TRINITY_DN29921_c0_g1~~TRINITY_DN29921_c0_g1_i3.p1  ORF type:complete len:553 (-),score=130.52 TRINITY_DN29921_c0_g1_i3:205-1863(-)